MKKNKETKKSVTKYTLIEHSYPTKKIVGKISKGI